MNTKPIGRTQTLMFPVAEELINAGHKVLAVKVIARATIVDIVILQNRRAAIRRSMKLTKATSKLAQMETEICGALNHNHHEN